MRAWQLIPSKQRIPYGQKRDGSARVDKVLSRQTACKKQTAFHLQLLQKL
jgi:hypothetical protein